MTSKKTLDKQITKLERQIEIKKLERKNKGGKAKSGGLSIKIALALVAALIAMAAFAHTPAANADQKQTDKQEHQGG